ncbi:MAG: hypothetical protein KAI62_06710 [Actinomycetia bacterium]|nr:hypothetical protein [Actinomycetes bacterium]
MLGRTQRRNEIIIIIILTLIFSGLITYNVIMVQRHNKILDQRIERHEMLEARQLEKIAAREATAAYIELRSLIRSQDTADIIKFDTWYKKIEGEYLAQIRDISEEFGQKVISIKELKALVERRIGAAEDFKKELLGIDGIPEPLDGFYFFLLDFVDNDIYTWNEILGYYSENFSIENPSIIQNQAASELYLKNRDLYRQVEELRSGIYTEYGLESLL